MTVVRTLPGGLVLRAFTATVRRRCGRTGSNVMTDPNDDKRFQFVLRTLLIATALFGLFLGFAVWMKTPLLLLTPTILLVACCAWRATRASRAGIVVWAIGSEILAVFAYGSYVAPAEQEFRTNVTLALIGAALSIGAGTIFLFLACKRRPSRWHNVFCCLACFLLPIIWAFVFHPMAREACFARIMKRDAAYAGFVAEINAICVRLEHAPENEKAPVKLLGTGMPTIILAAGKSVPMHYKRLGARHFQLSFINSNGRVQVYDSRTPEHVWCEGPL